MKEFPANFGRETCFFFEISRFHSIIIIIILRKATNLSLPSLPALVEEIPQK
jgi:hypothetical protein